MNDHSLMTAHLPVESAPPAGSGFFRLRHDAPLHTSPEVLAVMYALADFDRQKYWQDGGDAICPSLQHKMPDSAFIVQWDSEPHGHGRSHDELRSSLRNLGPDGPMLVAGIVAALISELTATASSGDLLPMLGWRPWKRADRSRMHLQALTLLQLASQLKVVGSRRGVWKDYQGRALRTDADGPLFDLRTSAFATDTANSPESVMFDVTLGETLTKYLGVPKALPYLGRLSQLTHLGALTPTDRLARSYGLAYLIALRLNHGHPRRLTRRGLLDMFPAHPGPADVLTSKNPKRALTYDANAWKLLRKAGIISSKPDTTTFRFQGRARYGDSFLDDPIDLRPGSEIAEQLHLMKSGQGRTVT